MNSAHDCHMNDNICRCGFDTFQSMLHGIQYWNSIDSDDMNSSTCTHLLIPSTPHWNSITASMEIESLRSIVTRSNVSLPIVVAKQLHHYHRNIVMIIVNTCNVSMPFFRYVHPHDIHFSMDHLLVLNGSSHSPEKPAG